MKKYVLPFLIFIIVLIPIYFVRIENIEIKGNKEEWNTAENIKAELFSNTISKISFLNLISDWIGAHRKAAFVEKYDIVWKSPNSIEVQVYNKNIVGCVQYVSSFMYFDKNGVIVENSNRKLPGIPQVIGLDFAAVYLYEELEMYDEVAFAQILDIIHNLNSYNIHADQLKYSILSRKTKEELERERKDEEQKKKQNNQESKSKETSAGEATVLMTEEARQDLITVEDTIILRDQLILEVKELTIRLGSTDMLSGKLSELAGMLEDISEMKGIVRLENYDGREGNPYFSFEKK